MIRNSDLDVTTGIPNSSYTSFSGQPVTPDDVLVKYTYIGDANLSGAVSFDDYVGMDNAFFGLIPNLGWATGDINFDSVINFDDYSKVDQAFFFQGPPLSGEAGVAAVPEPGTSGSGHAYWFRSDGLRTEKSSECWIVRCGESGRVSPNLLYWRVLARQYTTAASVQIRCDY